MRGVDAIGWWIQFPKIRRGRSEGQFPRGIHALTSIHLNSASVPHLHIVIASIWSVAQESAMSWMRSKSEPNSAFALSSLPHDEGWTAHDVIIEKPVVKIGLGKSDQ